MLSSQNEARIFAASTPVPLPLHRLRNPQKLREYLASGDYLALRIEKTQRTLAKFAIVTRRVSHVSTADLIFQSITRHCRLRDCQRNHSSCSTVREFCVLSRALDLEIPNDPDSVLLETWDHERSPDGEYAALSLSWGPSGLRPTPAINTNIVIREKEIAISDLSNTVHGAIFATRSLGIHYLWVDALCIVQDEDLDWATQSRQVAPIYKQAVLTIVASCAPNLSTGFHDIETRSNMDVLYKIHPDPHKLWIN
jgi:hypothetical protein